VRFTTSHPRDFTRDIVQAIDAVRRCATMCTCRCSQVDCGAACDEPRVHARVVPGANCLDQGGEARDQHDSDIIVGFPGETEQDLEDTATLLEEVKYDSVFAFKYPAAEHAGDWMADSIPERRKPGGCR